jgi:hypothetical protein
MEREFILLINFRRVITIHLIIQFNQIISVNKQILKDIDIYYYVKLVHQIKLTYIIMNSILVIILVINYNYLEPDVTLKVVGSQGPNELS